MKTIDKMHKELLKTYKFYNKPSLMRMYSRCHYQKKIIWKKGIKYFINCSVYSNWIDHFEFDCQFINDDRSINIQTVSRTNDPEEEYRKYPTLKEIEVMFEKMWIAYWGEYYE